MRVGGRINELFQKYGGKGAHLLLLEKGGFDTLPVYFQEDLEKLKDEHPKFFGQTSGDDPLIVRSSASDEDSTHQTLAGKYFSIPSVHIQDIEEAVKKVRTQYNKGNVVVQPDVSEYMLYSGVIYTNLDGKKIISMGEGDAVHSIVSGNSPETEILIAKDIREMVGKPVRPRLGKNVEKLGKLIEEYFDRPMDIEFAVIDVNDTATRYIPLQARPLPNPTDAALREHELRKLRKNTTNAKSAGAEELILGGGNYREILGDESATLLSVSVFNRIFSGNGKNVLGAVQLGRNELGYSIGHETSPWVLMLGGRVYYNFVGDALQFRPEGIDLKDLMEVVNGVYLPKVRGDPDLVNYPELRLYAQFPEQATQVGLEINPYNHLAEKLRKEGERVRLPTSLPKRISMREMGDTDSCYRKIERVMNSIRTGSAKDYVKAARLAFFAMEDLRRELERLRSENPSKFDSLSEDFSQKGPEKLRDAIAYDETVDSFDAPDNEKYKYIGSFELTLPRGAPAKKVARVGKSIRDKQIEEKANIARKLLANRERVKFFLFRDYDYLRQAVGQLAELSGFESDIYNLDFNELSMALQEPLLGHYRIDLRKEIRKRKLFPDIVFESEPTKVYAREARLVYGNMRDDILSLMEGKNCYTVTAVDQTVEIPSEAEVVLVSDNIRPGSHLFTSLSGSRVPVIAVPPDKLEKIKGKKIKILKNGESVDINPEEDEQ